MAKRIVIVIGSLQVGGAERQITEIVPRLDRSRWQVDIITLTQPGPLAAQLKSDGFRVFSPPLVRRSRRSGGPLRLFRAAILMPWLWLWFLRHRPDIAHFVLPEAYLVGSLCALLAGQKRMIMSRRSLAYYQKNHPVLATLERALHRRMSIIIANSEAIRRDLRRERAPNERLWVIRNGVDTNIYRPNRALGTAWRATMGIGPDQLVLVIVANLIPYKGHADLIAALDLIKSDLPRGWRLLCVGRDDGIGERLRDQAEAAGLTENIRFLGPRNEIPALINTADISILSSHEEGLPNAVIEAMATSKPVIATKVGGTSELIDDGVTGILVPPGNTQAMSKAILGLSMNGGQRQAMGQAAYKEIERAYDISVCARAYDDIYQLVTTHPKGK
ncbi:MAG: glycosyl transferase group 1 family protein [Alphaproteobacteria bacterium]|nr:glycosyl transferase group 1 family protein [Alphaproteobacteria bacterium]